MNKILWEKSFKKSQIKTVWEIGGKWLKIRNWKRKKCLRVKLKNSTFSQLDKNLIENNRMSTVPETI
jgi:hypothetical protein